MSEPFDLESLQTRFNRGDRLKFLFFWGHTPKQAGLGKECFSQWYPASFELDDFHYQSAEHYMMAEKARLFGALEIHAEILAAKTPGAAKELGRRVANFDEILWREKRCDIVVAGNIAKFSQNRKLGEFLLSTGARILVEASPTDRIWGIGLAQQDQRCENPTRWRGLNLLGFALMRVRSRLSGET